MQLKIKLNCLCFPTRKISLHPVLNKSIIKWIKNKCKIRTRRIAKSDKDALNNKTKPKAQALRSATCLYIVKRLPGGIGNIYNHKVSCTFCLKQPSSEPEYKNGSNVTDIRYRFYHSFKNVTPRMRNCLDYAV